MKNYIFAEFRNPMFGDLDKPRLITETKWNVLPTIIDRHEEEKEPILGMTGNRENLHV